MASEVPLPAIEAALEPIPIEVAPADESKPTTKAKPKSRPSHPPYEEMVKDAIVTLNEKSGSSQYAIQKFLEEKHKNLLPANFRKLLLFRLKKLVSNGKILKVKGSFKLPPSRVSAPKAKPAAAKLNPKVKPNASVVAASAKPKEASPIKVATTVVKVEPDDAKSKVTAPKPKLEEKPTKAPRTLTSTSPGREEAPTASKNIFTRFISSLFTPF